MSGVDVDTKCLDNVSLCEKDHHIFIRKQLWASARSFPRGNQVLTRGLMLLLNFKRTIYRPRLHNYQVDASESNIGNRPLAGSERAVSGVIRPNGSGSFGFCRRKGELKRERTLQCDRKAKILGVNYLDWDKFPGEQNTTRVVTCYKKIDGRIPLTLSEPLMGRKKKKRVAAGLTRHGIRTIESGLALMERKYGVRGLGFYTLTCPFDKTEDINRFNAAFPTIVKRTLESIKRYYEKASKKFSYVGVHEIQAARFARSRKQCLHFHFVAPCRSGRGNGFVCNSEQIRDWYQGAIRSALPDIDVPSPRVGVEVCRKSAASYIAKYYSKGVSSCSGGTAITEQIELSSWYVVCRGVLRATKKAGYNVDSAIADAVYSHNIGNGEGGIITFSRQIKVLRNDCQRLVGYVFSVSKEFLEPWLEHVMLEVSGMI